MRRVLTGAVGSLALWGQYGSLKEPLRPADVVLVDSSSSHDNLLVRRSAQDIADNLATITKKLGVDSVHLVAHSKGGLDSVKYLARHWRGDDQGSKLFDVLSLTTIGSPLRGSVLADMVVARRQAIFALFIGFPPFTNELFNIVGVFLPGLENLTTAWTARFMSQDVPLLPSRVVYNTIGSDLDVNGNGAVSCTPDETKPIPEFFVNDPWLGGLVCEPAKAILLDNLYRDLRRVREAYILFNIILGEIIMGIPEQHPQGNDILITKKSARGPQIYQDIVAYSRAYDGSNGRNHLSVVDEGVAIDIIPWLKQIEHSHMFGDFRPFATGLGLVTGTLDPRFCERM